MKILFTTITTLLLTASVLPAQRSSSRESLHVPPEISAFTFPSERDVYNLTTSPHETRPVALRSPVTLCLIPALFFDGAGSTAIPPRYSQLSGRSSSGEYSESAAVYGLNGFHKYYDILNILGSRMSRNQNLVVGLKGWCSSEPGEGPDVAEARADAVREYLGRIWGIESDRLPRLEPGVVDAAANVLLQQEGRRVEFVPENLDAFLPVEFSTEQIFIPVIEVSLKIVPNVSDPEQIESIVVLMYDEEEELLGTQSLEVLPEVTSYSALASLLLVAPNIHRVPQKLVFVTEVRLLNGEVRRSLASSIGLIPAYESRKEDAGYYRFLIPGFSPGDTSPTTVQRFWVDHYVNAISGKSGSPLRSGVLLQAYGRAELGDHSGQEGEYLDALFSSSASREFLRSPEYEEAMEKLMKQAEKSGFSRSEKDYYMLAATQPLFLLKMIDPRPSAEKEAGPDIRIIERTEDYVEEVYNVIWAMEYGLLMRYEQMARPVSASSVAPVGRVERKLIEDTVAIVESLSRGRARSLIRIISANPNVNLLNDQVPAVEGLPEDHPVALIRQGELPVADTGGIPVLDLPEKRWYYRSVEVSFRGEDDRKGLDYWRREAKRAEQESDPPAAAPEQK